MLLILAAGLLGSCGRAPAPGVTVVQGELGPFNALPLFQWTGDGSNVQLAEFTLDDGETWTTVDPTISQFRPDSPLDAGSYTLSVRYRLRSGWSETADETFTVSAVPISEPDDEFYASDQWALQAIEMPLAWGLLGELFPVRDEVIVAVIDTGYLDHPDIDDNILADEGYDFISAVPISNDGDGLDPDAHDAGDDEGLGFGNSWHGTSVAGSIAAESDNTQGIAGVARESVKIMPLRALGVGGGLTYDIAQAVLYAAGLPNDSLTLPGQPAKIINMSLGGGGQDTFLESVLQAATEAGSIVVAATGNSSDDPNWVQISYPASSSYTIAAASTGITSEIAYYSQLSAELDIFAPGGDLSFGATTGVLLPSALPTATYPPLSTQYGYTYIQGTSFACPHVAGALAILASVDPSLDLETARTSLRRSGSNLMTVTADQPFEVGILSMASLIEMHFGGRVTTSATRPEFNLIEHFSVSQEASSRSESLQPGANPDRDPHSLIVVFRDTMVPEEVDLVSRRLESRSGIQSVQGGMRARLVEIDPDADVETVRDELLADPAVESVHYNLRYRTL